MHVEEKRPGSWYQNSVCCSPSIRALSANFSDPKAPHRENAQTHRPRHTELQIADSTKKLDFTPTATILTTAKMTSRPTVTIIGADGKASDKTATLPNVFKAPIRPDIVQYV